MSGHGEGRDRQEPVGGVEGDGGSGRSPKRRRIGFPADVEMEEAEEKDDQVELRLRVRQWGSEKIEVVRVRPDAVDLSAHTGLVALPEELRRCAGRVRELRVQSEEMKSLPAWVGELTGLQTLDLSRCSGLGALPAEIGALTALQMLNLEVCSGLGALPVEIGALTALQELNLGGCEGLGALPAEIGALTALQTLNLRDCSGLGALPVEIGALTALQTLDLYQCSGLGALPAEIGALTTLQELDLRNCSALHTPPPHVVRAGRAAVQQFLRDLAKGFAASHLVKVVLLGDQRAGKSSLADSLVLGRPATRAADDRTVGIDVRRWRLGAGSPVVANVFDAAGQRVYRATHGLFMSPGSLFLHVVRIDAPAEAAAAALLEWVGAVQQEAPGAAMGVVWTHLDWFRDGLCGGAGWQAGFLCVRTAGSAAEGRGWLEMRYLQQHGPPCELEGLGVVAVGGDGAGEEEAEADSGAATGAAAGGTDVRGKVVVLDCVWEFQAQKIGARIKARLPNLAQHGALGVIAVFYDDIFNADKNLTKIQGALPSPPPIPIMLMPEKAARILAAPGVTVTAYPDVTSATALAQQARVLATVHDEIKRQVEDVDDALRRLEEEAVTECTEGSRERGQDDAMAQWKQARARRDVALAVLDRHAMLACQVTDIEVQEHDADFDKDMSDSEEDGKQTEKFKQLADAATTLSTVHGEMQKLEEEMGIVDSARQGAQLDKKTTPHAEQLARLRQQRMQRPRLLCSLSVSSRTGQGLHEARRVLTALMEDTRLFPHVGMSVPLNYSMLERLAQQRREQASGSSPVMHFRGDASGLNVNADARIVDFDEEFVTLGWTHLCPLGSKGYYELEILRDDDLPQYGFVSTIFRCGFGPSNYGVGDDDVSWSIDGARQAKFHAGKTEAYESKWKTGDVLGLACDLQEMQILVSVNGSFAPPNGRVFQLSPDVVRDGLFAAFSGDEGKVRYNLGQVPFKHEPPSRDYCKFIDFKTLVTAGGPHDIGEALAVADRAAWETAVTEHVAQRATPALREVCSQAYAPLHALLEAAGAVGMERDEVLSALRFLHETGSVLHYSESTRRGSAELAQTVFMQPQWIIDGIKYVVREPHADDINEELREMDTKIRASECADDLDQYLGVSSSAGFGAGVLTRQLLTRHLWRDFAPSDRSVLLQLMRAFKLLRPLADTDTFLAPAMLPKDQELPAEYLKPNWWRPSRAGAAAVLRDHDRAYKAEMRVEYRVRGGRLPFGFMNELQVSISAQADQDEEQHFAPEAAVVDRVSGSVLSEAYTCGEGQVREWVILSRYGAGQTGSEGAASGEGTDCLRVMGWVELSAAEGATDWRLFRRVSHAIEGMEQKALGLSLQKIVWHVDAGGKAAKPLTITCLNATRLILRFDLENGEKTDVKRELVVPSNSVIPLKGASGAFAAGNERPRIDAFFAKTVDDGKIDVHAEGQLMMRLISDAGGLWECDVHPQPMLDDLYSSIDRARPNNTRGMHLAGHSRKECGFIWNANNQASASREFDVDAVALAIGSIAGQHGPLEFTFLNACSTLAMGQKLRQRGVPYVVCWKTPVQDETARELCEHYYRALLEDKSGARDYRRAFFSATDAMRLSASKCEAGHSKSASLQRRRSTRRNASPVSGVMLEGDMAAGARKEDGESTRGKAHISQVEDVVLFLSQDGDSDPIQLWREREVAPVIAVSAAGKELGEMETVDAELKAVFQQKGLTKWCADICAELGIECVDDLKYVKCELIANLSWLKLVQQEKLKEMVEGMKSVTQKAPTETGQAAAAATIRGDSRELPRRIYAFFSKQAGDSIQVHGEAQKVMENLVSSSWWKNFELDPFVLSTYDSFRDTIRNSSDRNVVTAYFAGHCGEDGSLCFNKDSSGVEMEMLGPKFVVRPIAGARRGAGPAGGTIEATVLNTCYSRALGLALREHGVMHVVCWHGKVRDSIAAKFAEEYFKELTRCPTDYKRAFDAGRLEVERLDASAADCLCFLSDVGQVDVSPRLLEACETADAGSGSGRGSGPSLHTDASVPAKVAGDADDSRMANNTKGRAEMKGFRELGISLTYNGNDIEHAITLYENSALDRMQIQQHGLQESHFDLWRGQTKIAGKKLLMIHAQALQQIFGDTKISSYQDLWREDGAVERRARQASRTSRLNALVCFRESLDVRVGQAARAGADAGHQHMVSQMKECIKRMEAMDKGSDARKDGKQAKKTPATAAGGNMFTALAGSDDEDDMDVD